MSPKDADGMANSLDPDQTAPLIRVYTVCPGLFDHYGTSCPAKLIISLWPGYSVTP